MEFCLKIITTNTYDQKSVTILEGDDFDADSFLERCFQYHENDVPDFNLRKTVDEPEDFGNAGGFVSEIKNWEFYQDGVSKYDILQNFNW